MRSVYLPLNVQLSFFLLSEWGQVKQTHSYFSFPASFLLLPILRERELNWIQESNAHTHTQNFNGCFSKESLISGKSTELVLGVGQTSCVTRWRVTLVLSVQYTIGVLFTSFQESSPMHSQTQITPEVPVHPSGHTTSSYCYMAKGAWTRKQILIQLLPQNHLASVSHPPSAPYSSLGNKKCDPQWSILTFPNFRFSRKIWCMLMETLPRTVQMI
jgi:hypothetical protein